MKIVITLEESLTRASQGLRRKILYSVDLLRKAERLAMTYDKENGYYLAFSGGKDSQALYHLAQLAGVLFEAHMNLTSVDPPELIRFVRRCYPEVELIKPKASIYQLAVEKQILPTMRVRWCCAEYKEMAGAGKVTLIGIRRQESHRRKKRNEVEISSRKYSGTLEGLDAYREKKLGGKTDERTGEVNITNATEERTLGCISGKESLLISPILHWTERDVWEFLNEVVRVPHCELYDQGFHRIGCIGCPMSQHRQKILENERWPHVKRNWLKAIKAIRAGGGVSQGTPTRRKSGKGEIRTRYTMEEVSLSERATSGGTFRKTSRHCPTGGSDYGYILHPDPSHWGVKKRTNRGLWAGFRTVPTPAARLGSRKNKSPKTSTTGGSVERVTRNGMSSGSSSCG